MLTKIFEPFEKKIWLSSPTMHGEEIKYILEAYESNWVSTIGKNLDEVEHFSADKIGCKYAVALSTGTSALHLAIRIAGEKIYGKHPANIGSLHGHKVFCSDMTFDASVNPVSYEGGEAIFIDAEYDTWNMDPTALEKAFDIYPEVKLVVVAHLYGTPGKIDEIKTICEKHGALIVEDAAESFGASYKGIQTGNLGDFSVISFNGNKIITGSSGGMFLTNNEEDANKVRKWSTQSRENAPWYQHEEIGYNYRMSNIIAGIIRGQLLHLEQHISRKKEIYEHYKKGLEGIPVSINPYDIKNSSPNFWLSCILVDQSAMCRMVRGDDDVLYIPEHGKSCPTEILNAISDINAEGRPIWKPMHMQPIYRNHVFITREGNGRAKTNAYIPGGKIGIDGKAIDVGMDIFQRGICLPSDIKMTLEQQDKIINLIRACFE